MQKIKFNTGSSSAFFNSLDKEVKHHVFSTGIYRRAKRSLWVKMFFYFLLHLGSYLLLFFQPYSQESSLIFNYIFVGLSGLLLAFNVSHDACHDTFSKNKNINYWLYHLSFNMQGTNAYLWKIRHTSSHHVFPNVDGCDADIDDNPILRLSPQHPLRQHQRYQYIYAFFVYSVYTLHWFLIKDVMYLFKKRIANISNKGYAATEILLFIFWKLAYLFILIGLPLLKGYTWAQVLPAFLIMHVIDSLVFIHLLIATHLCMETQFPKTGEDGFLPYDYYTHQLATSLDYAPHSKIYNFILGGFNAHAAHHLYPKLPHTVYPEISELIANKAKEFNIRYNRLSLLQAIRSHYQYLRMMGTSSREVNDQSLSSKQILT